MANETQNGDQIESLTSLEIIDDIQNLYIGYIDNIGQLWLGDKRLDAHFRGELLFHSDGQDVVVIQRLRRLALFGSTLPFPNEDLTGLFSIVGPLTTPQVAASPTGGSIEDLALKFHYEALPILYKNEDVVFYTAEQLAANVSWSQEDQSTDGVVWTDIELTFNLVETNQILGLVQHMRLKLSELYFHPLGSEEPRGEPHNSIQSHCGPPNPNCSFNNLTIERRLPVKFINLVLEPGNLDITDICNQQINGVGEVWRSQAALDLTVWPNQESYSQNLSSQLQAGEIDEAPLEDKEKYSQIDSGDEGSLVEFRASIRTAQNWGHAEIYLVDALDDNAYPGGGATVFGGEANAFCILQLNKAKDNSTLLAHELGHVLGLDHPNPPLGSSLVAGTAGSIMDDANVPKNSTAHCTFLATFSSVNPMVKYTTIPDCFNPQMP